MFSLKNKKGKFAIVNIQVWTLILSLFAFCFIISMADNAKIVSAEVPKRCCEEVKESEGGGTCQELLVSEEAKCKSGLFQGKCSEDTNCKLGCCVNENEGTCSSNSPKKKCESEGGKWSDDASCNIGKCVLGCCVLGDDASFVTEQRCQKLSGFMGVQMNFKGDIRTEIQCLALSKNQKRGACVLNGGNDEETNCKVNTKQECLKLGGKFSEGFLCTSKLINSTCEKTEETTCVEGKDEVYFKDSCGNIANIYDYDKRNSEEYWEKIVDKVNSCDANDKNGNAKDKRCGNCNYFLGSKCTDGSARIGKKICGDLNCKYNGKNYKNGESWCEYDDPGMTGGGLDRPGSRHFKFYCLDGEVKSEACEDYRNGICAESSIDIGSGEKFKTAACRLNRWTECISYNTASTEGTEGIEKMKKECEKNPDCFVATTEIDDDYVFDMCVPHYPPGFDLSEEGAADGEQSEAQSICALASTSCTVVYEKKLSGWECVYNCNCEEKEFTKKMHNLCQSLGDCGTDTNYIENGLGTDGYEIVGAPELEGEEAVTDVGVGEGPENPNPNSGLGISTDMQGADYDADDMNIGFGLGATGALLGAAGIGILVAAGQLVGATSVVGFGGALSGLMSGTITIQAAADGSLILMGTEGAAVGVETTAGMGAYAFANAALAGAAVMAAAVILTYAFGLQGDAAMVMMISGAVLAAATTITMSLWSGAGTACASLSPIPIAGWIACAIIVIIVLIVEALTLFLLEIGETEEKIVTFNCYPWQAPNGGGDRCKECTEDKLKPCSSYRCTSLGQNCKLLNAGTGAEICYDANPHDTTPPQITPYQKALSQGFKYKTNNKGFEITTLDGSCVPAFTPLIFGVKTNEPAQCKMDTQHSSNYDKMNGLFGNMNLYSYNHTTSIMLPSVESLGTAGVGPNVTGDMKFYVRCKDGSGNWNINEYLIDICVSKGPDKTPPLIQGFNPASENYVKFGKTNLNMSLFVNEPSECKYSREDKEYNLMENNMTCNTDLSLMSPLGWDCSAELNLQNNTDTFFFRCKDQPWFAGVNESLRNINRESSHYSVKKSLSELKIDYLRPNGTIITGKQNMETISIEAKTSGGADGTSKCDYSFNNQDYITFFNTYSSLHTQTLSYMVAGEYKIDIKCEDEAGNEANATSNFRIEIDNLPPIITRFYNQNGLTVITNEKAECRYSTSEYGCDFDYNNATSMSGNEKEHTIPFNPGKYYIKCKDNYGNYPGSCSIILKTYTEN